MRCSVWPLLVAGLVAATGGGAVDAAEILAISPIASGSHWTFMSSVLDVLLDRGHKVSVVTAYRRPVPHENYTHIDIAGSVDMAVASAWDVVTGVYTPPRTCLKFLNEAQRRTCEVVFEHPALGPALRARRYDLVITELLASRCDAFVASHLGVPHVAIVSSPMLTWYRHAFDCPSNPSYVPTLHAPYTAPSTFAQRLWNIVDHVVITAYSRYVDAAATAVGRARYGGQHPDADALLRNVSLVLLNTHSDFDLHKPVAANFKEIGGVHLKPAKPLPADLQKFIDSAEHGVIYFNLGSVIRMEELPISIQTGIKEGFAELPQKILWKFESNKPMINQSRNVFTRKWFPQYDVIRHPNVKLFITHGGNSGTIEAISAGIPVLGFPVYFDQPRNSELFKHWGTGLCVDYKNFTKEDFVDKIKRILNDHRFRENANALSRRFHDRPLSPQDTVAYWTNYVLEHNGAHHLKSHATSVEWYEYYSLDLFALAIAIVISILYFVYGIVFIK